MQKYTVIGGFILVLGVLVFAVAFALKGFDIRKISTRPELVERNYTVTSTNQNIRIKDSNVPITVKLSKDGEIHLNYYESEDEYYEVEEGGTLVVEKKTKYKWYNYIFNVNFQSPTFTLLLPKDFAGELDISTSNGSITMEDISAALLELKSSNGSLNISRVTNAKVITAETSNSPISISDLSVQTDLMCNTSNGSIQLDNILAQSINANTSNSRITATDTKSIKSTVLETSNGGVEVRDIESGSISLKSSNSSIKGRIKGKMTDFSITSKTSNGSNNLPEKMKGGDKTLRAETSNGSINIEFTD